MCGPVRLAVCCTSIVCKAIRLSNRSSFLNIEGLSDKSQDCNECSCNTQLPCIVQACAPITAISSGAQHRTLQADLRLPRQEPGVPSNCCLCAVISVLSPSHHTLLVLESSRGSANASGSTSSTWRLLARLSCDLHIASNAPSSISCRGTTNKGAEEEATLSSNTQEGMANSNSQEGMVSSSRRTTLNTPTLLPDRGTLLRADMEVPLLPREGIRSVVTSPEVHRRSTGSTTLSRAATRHKDLQDRDTVRPEEATALPAVMDHREDRREEATDRQEEEAMDRQEEATVHQEEATVNLEGMEPLRLAATTARRPQGKATAAEDTSKPRTSPTTSVFPAPHIDIRRRLLSPATSPARILTPC